MKLFIILFSLILHTQAMANNQLKVVTTTTTLKSLVTEIGGPHVQVDSLTTNSQDPHFVESKPSYMVKLRDADLLVAVGLELEVGWLGLIQRGSKNPKILDGSDGFIALGSYVTPIERPNEKIDRSMGDVHPEGNPHFHTNPIEMLKAAQALTKRLAELDKNNAEYYQQQLKNFDTKINLKMKEWEVRVAKVNIKNILTYHRSFNYFLDHYKITPVAYIEPKPGIPPTAKHIISLIETLKKKNVHCIFNESYFETTAAERIKKETQSSLQILPVEVQTDYMDLIESLVVGLEKCAADIKGR